MLRRNTRLRREYLYRKSLEGKEKEDYEKKQRLRQALQEGKAIPNDLLREQEALRAEIEMDDSRTEIPRQLIDDEYARAAVRDPKIFITTSRNPSSRLAQFAKEMRLVFPNATRMNRGGYVVKQLVEACRANEITDMIILHEHRGEPDGMIVSHLPYGPTAYFGIINCVLRHDIQEKTTMSQQNPHLIFHKFDSKLGERTQTILKHLFPVPKEDSTRTISFVNQNDFISFRHHLYKKEGHKEVQLKEIGPRFELRLYQIKLGTVDMVEAENEWVLRPYLSNSRSKQHLSLST
ncbi:U3 small nucleolar ribonucleoprotein IMP4 [Balamuthia mandrillaris]